MTANDHPIPRTEATNQVPNRLGQFLALSLATVVCALLAILATV